MAGGGIKPGFIYGATDESGYHAVEDRDANLIVVVLDNPFRQNASGNVKSSRTCIRQCQISLTVTKKEQERTGKQMKSMNFKCILAAARSEHK